MLKDPRVKDKNGGIQVFYDDIQGMSGPFQQAVLKCAVRQAREVKIINQNQLGSWVAVERSILCRISFLCSK